MVKNIECTNLTDKLNLIIYYPRNTIKNVVRRSNNSQNYTDPETNQYHIWVQLLHWRLVRPIKSWYIKVHWRPIKWSYYVTRILISIATTTLSRRLTMHRVSGRPNSVPSTHYASSLRGTQLCPVDSLCIEPPGDPNQIPHNKHPQNGTKPRIIGQ